MKRLVNVFAAISLFVLAIGTSSAAVIFTASLTHDQEVVTGTLLTSTGLPRPLSRGFATLLLNDAQTELAMTVTIFNIDITGTQTPDDTNDNLRDAHIHVGAPPGVNAPVRWGFFGSPDNDNNPDNLVVTPFLVGVGGTFTSIWNQPEGNAGTTLTSNLPAILANLSYLNFHTVQFPGGEIRGQIIVPEPESVALIMTAALAAWFMRRRARR
ncbi:MAG TPA: CHRD domain-containing protein [Casimicrobiaceae bacterium]|nr:CHRD domain-containing protein [Casimicrobiaceae bacterium]